MKFSPALENKNSPEYRNFTNTFCSEVDKVFHNSDMEDIYDGCIVTQIRNGSITVNFLVIFVSKVSPIDSDVKSVLITTAVEKEAGIPITVLGIFVVEATTVFIGEVRIIATEDNPTPRKEFGSRCKVSQSCKTFQAECLDNKCACVVSRHYHRQTDACLLSTTLPEPASSSTRATETKASIPFSKTSTASTITNTQFVSTSAFKKNTSSSSTQMITSEASKVSSSISASVTDNLTTEAQSSLSTSPVISTSALASTSTTDRRIPYSSLTDVKSSTSTDSIISNRATAVSETKTTLSSTAVVDSSTSKTSRKTSTKDTATLTTETKSSTASYTTKTFPTSTTLVISSTRSVASSTIESKPSVPSFLVSSQTSASISRTSRSSLTTSPTMLILPSLTATAETESSSSSPTRITSPSSTTATRVGTTSIDTLTTEANPYASSSTKLTSPVSVSSAGSTKTLDRTTARIKSTSTTILTTTPIEFVPVLQLLVPSAHKLEIGSDDRIICEISNVTDWSAIVLSKTSEGGNKHLIGNVTKSDDTWTANYGNGIGSHQYMFLQGFDIQYSANLTLVFNTVQCDDAATYHCSAVPPGGSVAVGEISVTLDVFKKPSLQLNIPNDLREGMVNLSISCSASFGFPQGNSTLMQRLAGETAFTPISQPGQNEVEVRRNEIVDSDYACLKTVQYEFYTGLEGWNMTQIRCAINDGTGNETISDVGVIFIVPKTVCSGRENQNVTHPFNCQLYVSCTTDAVDWGSIHSSNCAGKECWLADGQCGTTTTAAVTTTPTRTTLLPGTPNMICDPKLQSAKSGDSVVYRCSLMYVDKVTQIAIPQIDFNEVNDSGISGEFVVSPGVKLQVHLESEDAIVLSFEKVDCALEGGITIGINDDVSKTVELRLIADATTPNLITPTSIHRNQEAAFLCSANLGRLDDGSEATYLEFQIKLKGNNVPITVNRGIEVLSISSSDCQNEVTMQFKLLATDLLNDGEIGCISTDIATKTQHLSAFSGPITILEPNVFFGAFNYDGVIGETISVSCAFQGIPDVQNITITRAVRRDNVLTAYRDGSSRQSMLHFNITEAEWGKDSGSFTISFTPQCGDGEMYYCAVAGFVTACIIDTKKRPEKPVLTLSVEMVEGQESSADGRSECRGEVGSPAGDLVIQILRNMTFSEYEVVFVDGYPMDIESDCGTVRTFQFYFEDLSDLNNTQTRCAVKNSEAFLGEALPVSETHIIQVVPGSYCDKINSSFHVHPYNCHYFVDCNIFGPGNLDFTKCIDPNSCPSELTGCHPEACEVLCAKDTTTTSAQTTTASTMTSATTSTTTSATTPQLYPYLKCNETVMADLGSALILDCELENIVAKTIEVYHDGFMLFNESGFSGGLTSANGFITLTYSNLHIQLSVSELQCEHDGVYAVIVNEVVQANLTIVIQRSPNKPLITASRFVLNQEATITCQGSLGKPKGSRDMQIEARFPGASDFQPAPIGLSDEIKFDILQCAFVKTVEFSLTVVTFFNSTEVRCKTISEKGNFSSSSVFFNIEEQEVEIIPQRPEVELGQALAVQCLVTNVLGLTSIKFYHKNTSRPICDVVGNVITSAVDGVTCSGETTVTSGQLQVEFASLRCDDEGNYICECNTEASTPVLMPLTVTTQPTIPVFTSIPLTLVENTDMLETEALTCEADLGYPNPRSLVIQTNKEGDFKIYNFFEIDKTTNEEDCNVMERIDVNPFAFDISWNNSQLRCVIEDDNGNVTDYISEAFSVTLLPEFYCEGQDRITPHPFDTHDYINCTDKTVYVQSCYEKCPVISDGTVSCDTC